MKTLKELISKSKKHLKENNLPLEYLCKHISKTNNLNENEISKQLSEYYLNKFLKSNNSNFEKFLEEEMETEIEEEMSGMTMSTIPVSVRPEKPIEELSKGLN